MTIAFTKSRLPYGWMGNMSPHSVTIAGKKWRTAEHAFQALRFPQDHPVRGWLNNIESAMDAKLMIDKHRPEMEIIPCSPDDLVLMRDVTWAKLQQNGLTDELLSTGDQMIIEDVTKRQRGNNLFWGAALIDGEWSGDNWLGHTWMAHRADASL